MGQQHKLSCNEIHARARSSNVSVSVRVCEYDRLLPPPTMLPFPI